MFSIGYNVRFDTTVVRGAPTTKIRHLRTGNIPIAINDSVRNRSDGKNSIRCWKPFSVNPLKAMTRPLEKRPKRFILSIPFERR